MRAVAVNQNAGVVELVISIAGQVRATVDHMHALAGLGQFAGDDGSGETGADDQIIKLISTVH
jgi:hypothetical protein